MNKNTPIKLTSLAFGLCLVSTSAYAATIAIGPDDWTNTTKDNNAIADTVIDDSTLSLTASTNGQEASSNVSDGSNWDLKQGIPATAKTATEAFSVGTYIDFTFDSTGNHSDLFSLDTVSVSLWRNGAQAPNNFQLAYSADATWTTADLLGSVKVSSDTAAFTITDSSLSLPDSITTASVRLYYWDDLDGTPNNTANIHLTDVSGIYTVVPEPSSFALLAGLMGLTTVALRRRNEHI